MGLSPSAGAPASHCDLRKVQRLTARLGVFTGRRHGELIRRHFGRVCAKVSDAGLTAAVIGSLVTEFIGVADIGEFNGISRGIALPLAAVTLPPVVCAGSCRRSSCRTDRRRQVLNAFRLPVVNGLVGSRCESSPGRQLAAWLAPRFVRTVATAICAAGLFGVSTASYDIRMPAKPKGWLAMRMLNS